MRYFTFQFGQDGLDAYEEGDRFHHLSSSQFRERRLASGDVVYVLGLSDGYVEIVTRVEIADVVSRATARKRLNREPWEGKDVALLRKAGVAPALKGVRIPGKDVRKLRFVTRSKARDRLQLDGKGRPKQQQLRRMRELTLESAELLDDLLVTQSDRKGRQAEREFEVIEGQKVTRTHTSRERDPRVRRAKIAAAKKSKRGLACEACGFDFGATYGEVGEGYIECHHIVPLNELDGARTTRLRDLALLCANCHRVIHRKLPWLRMAELMKSLQDNRP